MKQIKLLWLYSEVAGYLHQAMLYAVEHQPELSFHIVRYPLNAEAPFLFEEHERIHWYNKSDFENENQLASWVRKLNPTQIFCSGWNDRLYTKTCKTIRSEYPTTLLLDNYWENSLKQHIASLLGPNYLKQRFSSAWVPGQLHVNYANKLGFKKHQVFTGLYSANVQVFNQAFSDNQLHKKNDYPHRFLYVGRYLTLKGVKDLWGAFKLAKQQTNNDWELWMVGTGELFDEKQEHPAIKHLGFKQPNELPALIGQSGVFVMPSHYDHWGVAVHEFAASGLPLLCSEKVGAATQFLIQGENGYLHPIKKPKVLAKKMLHLMSLSNKELNRMGKKSHELAQTMSFNNWLKTLNELLKK